MSTLQFRDVFDGISKACSMIAYFYIWNLTWINIRRIEETTKYCESNWGDLLFIVTIFFYLWKLPCAAMFLFAILEFRCIECFAYALVSLVFNIFLCLNTYPSFLVSHSFSSVLLSRNCYVCLVPPHLQGPVIVRVVFVYPSFADPACSPSLPQSGSDYTYFYR